MDEKDWLEGRQVGTLLIHLIHDRGAQRTARGRRQLRLFMCACLRRVWDELGRKPVLREVVRIGEEMADGASPEISKGVDPGLAFAEGERNAVIYLTQAATAVLMTRNLSGFAYSSPQTVRTAVGMLACEAQGLSPFTSREGVELTVAAQHAEDAAQVELLRDVFGNPFRPPVKRRFPAHVRSLGRACYDGDAAAYAVLADALADLGEDAAAAHCREPGHVKGCHVVDWVLGKAG
jgi:hypothetical protein